MPTLIFVHGACVRDGAWWWSRMTEPLADRGIASVAVALPSCGESGGELGDLYADVEACRRAIAAAEGPVVLCGHSYGGMVITEAGADDRVTQLLYVTSVMPDAGQSQADLIGSEPAPWLLPGDDGTVGVDPDLIREFFLQDCDEATTEEAVARLTRQSLTPFTQRPARSPGSRSPRPTSSAPRTSRPPPRCSAAASARTPAGRVRGRPPPLPLPPRGVRREHRRRDPARARRRLSPRQADGMIRRARISSKMPGNIAALSTYSWKPWRRSFEPSAIKS